MGHFTTIQMLLDIPTILEAKEKEQIDIFMSLLDESNVAEILDRSVKSNTSKGENHFLLKWKNMRNKI